MRNISLKAISLLTDKKSFALATIVSQSGSSPRHMGSQMMIMKDGQILGTIGGGLLEGDVKKIAIDVIKSKSPYLLKFALDAKSASEQGMACGGDVEVFIDFVDGSLNVNLEIYSALEEILKNRKKVWLAQYLPVNDQDEILKMPCRQCIIQPDGTVIGPFLGLPEQKEAIKTKVNGYDVFTLSENKKMFLLSLGTDGTVLIFGAGHVGEKLAPVLSSVGFETIVFDDREEFANKQKFPTADKIIILKSFDDNLFKDILSTQNCYCVIVTRGHLHDKTVLTQALKTEASYIGMIGSKKKRDAVYTALLSEGFTQNDINRVYSPIGLDIKAETPEEIAVSIAAQLIFVRAGGGKQS